MQELVMKCDEVLVLLEEYLDGELGAEDQERVSEHLITCASCAEAFAALTAEQEMFVRYDREIKISPSLWSGIEEHIVPINETSYGWWMKIAAVFVLAIGLGTVYFLKQEKETPTAKISPVEQQQEFARFSIPKTEKPTRIKRIKKSVPRDNPDVLSSDIAYLDLDDQETADHIEKSQNLLRSIRNFPVSDGDEEIDVTYDKALSQRLLNENVVLRREAEMKAKFPTKTLLADLEPLLIDIANLPDHARPEDVRVIKERVQKTEIVAALTEYRNRGINNR
jgi:hypothetical protein